MNNKDGFGLSELIGWAIPIIMIMTGFLMPIGIIWILNKVIKLGKKQSPKQRQQQEQQQQQQVRQAQQTQTAKPNVEAVKPTKQQVAAAMAERQRESVNARLAAEKRKAKTLSKFLIAGGVILAIAGITTMSAGLYDVINGWYIRSDLWDIVRGGFTTVGAVVMFGVRSVWSRRVSMYQKYIAVIGGNKLVSVARIALGVGVPVNRARQDLQTMIDAGYFPESAFINGETDEYAESREALETGKAAESRKQEEERAKANRAAESQYMKILRELRELNDEIDDVSVSNQIDRIEAVSARIFNIVEQNPEKRPQIDKFMSYYLPTTLKLLNSYKTMEKQEIRGENISAAKENIDRILGTLAEGFEQQLDQLFRADVMDISTDINVLENMMARDGLMGESPFKTQNSDGSVNS
ncbi:MAG: 5-bromo-4-chloroindolyl phosphate hydrolysis family protein [Oscillospiraceae bacterium]|jgi:5-bromo-4-chloroindolyl phosphate hydrolysis protein|nr:5-bromo-4-chloroindolyl phosphate hydrolysis family protein [Oscillospiraceae bacterium]